MILGWSPSKICSGISDLRPRWHSTKVWLQLAQWFLRRRFLCEFPIGSYVKLSLAIEAILVEGPNRRTQSFSKIVSGSRALPPRWPPQCSCIVIESSFDPGEQLQAPGSLWLKRTIQWLFYQSLVPIEQLVPDKKIFMWISHRFQC
jgi:hypothetical protein